MLPTLYNDLIATLSGKDFIPWGHENKYGTLLGYTWARLPDVLTTLLLK
jgi:hypothetical protein